MESEENMELRDLPVDTRNYTIIDNITGKPIDQSDYTLTIDTQVINKLNELKRLNEEKIKQASLKSKYEENMLVDTFTPDNNAVFTPVYEGEYIDAQDYNTAPIIPEVEEKQEEEIVEEEKKDLFAPTEVIEQNTTLDRVVARDPNSIPKEEVVTEDDFKKQENNTTNENTEVVAENNSDNTDNSTFTPEMAGLQQASEQIVKIDEKNLGPAIKPPKHNRRSERHQKESLDKMEVKEARGYAWLAYILFFIPMLINRKNRFVRIHADEGLSINIMEILGAALIIPYFVVANATGTAATLIMVCALLGVVLIGMCALTIIPMIIFSLCGFYFQIPWLWKGRIIKVPKTRE